MRSLRVLAGLALVATLAACGSDPEPGASPPSGNAAGAAPSSPAAVVAESAIASPTPGRPAAPKVTAAKDAAGRNPCELVPAATVAAIGLGAGKLTPAAQQTARLDTCNWVGTGSNWMKSLIVSVNTKSGLDSTYNNRAIFTDFAELQVAGHPAVRANQGSDALGGCNLFVGLSDTQTLWVVGNSGTKNTMDQHCAVATQAAEAIVKALP